MDIHLRRHQDHQSWCCFGFGSFGRLVRGDDGGSIMIGGVVGECRVAFGVRVVGVGGAPMGGELLLMVHWHWLLLH